MERTALIYYSLDGNTHFIAQKMSKQLGCPVIRLKLQKEFSTTNKFLKFFWAGQSSVFRTKPPLANKAIDLKAYDTLVIASPVWAGSVSSPVRSFLNSYAIEGKDVYLVANSGGGQQEKCLSAMRKLLPKSTVRQVIGFASLTKETYPTHKQKLEAFCKEILDRK